MKYITHRNGSVTLVDGEHRINFPWMPNLPFHLMNPEQQDYQTWLDAGNTPEDEYTKEDALAKKYVEADKELHRQMKYDFAYGGNIFEFKPDKAVKIKAKDDSKNRDIKTKAFEADGVTPVKITMSKSEQAAFSDAMLDEEERREDVCEAHKESLRAIFLDTNSTVDDILNYDVTTNY